MRVWILPLVAVIAGAAIGSATSLVQFQRPELTLAGHEATAGIEPPVPTADAKPRVHLVDPNVYQFGVMARNEQRSHSFKVRNVGNGPLTLKVTDTTCKCTVGELGRDSIASGETADVTLTWTAQGYDREFRQSATIETSDQSQREIVFTISGQVIQFVRPDPPHIKFDRISRSEPRTMEIKLYAYRDDDLQVMSHDFSDPALAKFFSVTTEPLPPSAWDDREAKSAIRVRIEIAAGLPIGESRQVVGLTTNKPDIGTIEIGIDATVISDISVLGGREFDIDRNVLTLGPVPKKTGREVTLHVLVKERIRDQVHFSVAETDPPEAVQAELGEPIDASRVRKYPLRIKIPAGSPSVYRMDSRQGPPGRIVLHTGHPEIDTLEIKVRFVVHD